MHRSFFLSSSDPSVFQCE
uniref:Uncharacterized protein n=1 Tax=Arundo donax TaxID=35708 RepID=A0A0A8YEQ1_ARUDO